MFSSTASAFCVPFWIFLPILLHEDILLSIFSRVFSCHDHGSSQILVSVFSFIWMSICCKTVFSLLRCAPFYVIKCHIRIGLLLDSVLSQFSIVYPYASATISAVTALEQVLIFSSVAPPSSVLFLQRCLSDY